MAMTSHIASEELGALFSRV